MIPRDWIEIAGKAFSMMFVAVMATGATLLILAVVALLFGWMLGYV